MLGNVLIVEDNPVNIIILKKILEAVCIVNSAKSGLQAIKMLEENKYDLVLMDINLGSDEMTGLDILKKIRTNESSKDMPVVAITAYSHGESVPDFLEAGFSDLLPKPVGREQLLGVVHKYVT
jgi:CheY-like chemotaxis protein